MRNVFNDREKDFNWFLRSLIFAGLATIVFSSSAAASPMYGITLLDARSLLGVPADVSFYTYAWGINDPGEVVGYYNGPGGLGGYTYNNGSFSTFNLPGASATLPIRINDSGEIAGFYTDAQGNNHGFTEDGSTITTLDLGNGTDTRILGLDNKGDIAGTYLTNSGYAGFYYYNGVYHDLGMLNGGQTTAYDINNSGVVVGGGAAGFWISNGVVSPFAGALFGINDASLAVGTVGGIAVTYNGSDVTNLAALLGLNVGPDGLNNRGQIVGEYHPNQSESFGFIATPGPPVPEPSTLSTFLLGLMGLTIVRWRNKDKATRVVEERVAYNRFHKSRENSR